ncbi:MAG: hypothetical protein AB2531_14905, partial [Candidatus Thiodiazotropha sp.]
LVLYAMSLILIPECRTSAPGFGLSMLVAVVLFFLATQFDGLLGKSVFVIVVLTVFSYIVWHHVLEQKERRWLLQGLGIWVNR